MNRFLGVFLLGLTLFPPAILAQQTNTKAAVTDSQKDGRSVFQRKCAMCHVPATPSARTLGPGLSKALIEGNEDQTRDAITIGQTNLMPGFKYNLTSTQIANVIEYLKTVDSPVHTLSSEHPEK